MRKTSVVLALMVSSVLLLQTPAWAPKLYVAELTRKVSPADAAFNVVSVDGQTDLCKSQQVKLKFWWGETITKTSSPEGKFKATLSKVPDTAGEVTKEDVTRFTCNGKELPFTGASTMLLLAFGLSLLVAGTLLVAGARQGPVTRRG